MLLRITPLEDRGCEGARGFRGVILFVLFRVGGFVLGRETNISSIGWDSGSVASLGLEGNYKRRGEVQA